MKKAPMPEAANDTTLVKDMPTERKAILTLTDKPPGFTIGYAFSLDDQNQVVSQVDIVLMALMNVLRDPPKYFKKEINRVNAAVQKLADSLTDEDADTAAAVRAFENEIGIKISAG